MSMLDSILVQKFHEELKNNSENLDKTMSRLRELGYSQMDCAKLLVSELGYGLQDADERVLNSIAWSDLKDNNEKFRDEFGSFINEQE